LEELGARIENVLRRIVKEVDRNHDAKDPPYRYIVPWGLISEARDLLQEKGGSE
jgi:hypothetical protein